MNKTDSRPNGLYPRVTTIYIINSVSCIGDIRVPAIKCILIYPEGIYTHRSYGRGYPLLLPVCQKASNLLLRLPTEHASIHYRHWQTVS